jgi:hypothetical protein
MIQRRRIDRIGGAARHLGESDFAGALMELLLLDAKDAGLRLARDGQQPRQHGEDDT